MTPEDTQYLAGKYNRAIRYYFYLCQGLSVINDFRNLFLVILGIYIALKLANVLWMVGMFIPSVLLLTVLGYYNVHRVGKVKDFLTIKFSTHYGMKSFNYSQEQVKLLEEIKELLKQQKV